MKFQQEIQTQNQIQNQNDRIILVISDLHLGAGNLINGQKNHLEDFYFDRELLQFLEYYSSAEYENSNIELVINGDFLDFLATPFVKFFDDEFWSERASIEKLKLILNAHPLVIKELVTFISKPNKKVTYIIGNHDAEMIFNQVRELFLEQFPTQSREKIHFVIFDTHYSPVKEILIKHGHQYEPAHYNNPKKSLIKTTSNENFFLPPWGTYYVTKIINKFKAERAFINSIRPVRTFIIHGLLFDTLFTIRFIFANIYYFFMVIFLNYFRKKRNLSLREVIRHSWNEIQLFQDYEEITRDEFSKNPNLKVLIVGHTHIPGYRTYINGNTFINTGSWTKMFNMDFTKRQDGRKLTYALISIREGPWPQCSIAPELLVWEGHRNLPYSNFY
ncbi:MAG: metallophosphoesterase [Oligoflexia bacterium]|nr:metallophosphoesterase [Oligoflexia bacterium]